MKIVGFEANGALHLGVVEGDQVIDLQAGDKAIPGDLGECLRRNNGELSALKDAAKRAPASARRPLKGLTYGLPVAAPGKVMPRPQLSRARQGRLAARQHSEIPDHLHAWP